MTVKEVKLEALRIMFASNTDIITAENFENYASDDHYKTYVNMMNGAINRCFSDIERRHVLTPRTKALSRTESLDDFKVPFVRFKLADLIGDFDEVDRVVYADEYGNYDGDVTYNMEGDTLVLPNYYESSGVSYLVMYYPKIARLPHDDEDIGVPDEIAAAIPYYIKGDLFREDEPNEASEARNWYEAAMEQLAYKLSARKGKVQAKYRLTEI